MQLNMYIIPVSDYTWKKFTFKLFCSITKVLNVYESLSDRTVLQI